MSLSETAWQSVRRIADAWTGFWFAPQDPLSLGVLRVLVGGMMAYTHFVWGLSLEGFFGPDGWQSTEAVSGAFQTDWLPSLWWYVPVDQLRLVHVLCFVPLLMFMLGLLTPWTSVLALAITISNSNRAPLANYGLDQILSLLGLYLVIGGSGDAFSLDAWRRRRKSGRKLADGVVVPNVSRQPTSQARLGTRLIQVHFCVIYFFAGISKLQGEAWWNGEAVWMAFANKEYQSIDMTWLAHYPWIPQLATHATILFEISFAFLIWNRTLRPFILLAGVGMHAGIGLCMGMITFGSIMIYGYIAFVPPEVTQRVIDFAQRLVSKRLARPNPAGVVPAGHTPTVMMPQEAFTDAIEDDALADENASLSIAICDPDWKHRAFAHYLSHRGYRPFVCASPARVWQHVEQQQLCGVVIFIDRLTRADFELLLNDLTLSPISELPVVIASQRRRRVQQVDLAGLRTTRAVLLPQSFRNIRSELEAALADVPASEELHSPISVSREATPSATGRQHFPDKNSEPSHHSHRSASTARSSR